MHLLEIAKTAYQKLHDNEVLDSVEDYVKSTSLHEISLAIDEAGEDKFNKLDHGSEDHIGEEEVAGVSRVDNDEDLSEDDSMNNSADAEVNEYTLTDIEEATIGSETDECTELLEKKSKEPKNGEAETQLELDEDIDDHDETSKLVMRDERIDDSTWIVILDIDIFTLLWLAMLVQKVVEAFKLRQIYVFSIEVSWFFGVSVKNISTMTLRDVHKIHLQNNALY